MGADPNQGRPLISALNHRVDESVRLPLLTLLVDHGADVNQLYDIYGDESKLFSALDLADEGECRDYLLSVGAKGSDELKKAGRKLGEVYTSREAIRDKPVPRIKPAPVADNDGDPIASAEADIAIAKIYADAVIDHFTQTSVKSIRSR